MIPGASGHLLALFSKEATTMVIDGQAIFNILVGIILSGVAWFAKTLFDAVDRLREDLHSVELLLPNNYVQKEEFKDDVKTLNDKLDKIWAKLAEKADR